MADKTSTVKSVAFQESRGLLFTANERTIMLWDVVSMTNVGTLKGIKEEIKAMKIVGQQLFAGSKGSATSGALLIFDLRKQQEPIAEREKN